MNENFVVYGISVGELVYREFRTSQEVEEIALELESRRSNENPDNSRPYSDK